MARVVLPLQGCWLRMTGKLKWNLEISDFEGLAWVVQPDEKAKELFPLVKEMRKLLSYRCDYSATSTRDL